MVNYMAYHRENKYDRLGAVRYAKNHALFPNPSFKYFEVYETLGGDCTNFISQCLLAGNAPMTYTTDYAWWYNKSGTYNINDDKWSIPWAVAHSLYWTLKVNQQSGKPGPKGFEVDNVSILELGDLILYESSNGIIYHSAIITSFSNSEPLIAQHTFEALNISYLKTWKARRMHFMKISV